MGWLGAGGMAAYDYALEVVILAHSEGEIGVFGVAGVVMDNYALEVVLLAHSGTYNLTLSHELSTQDWEWVRT